MKVRYVGSQIFINNQEYCKTQIEYAKRFKHLPFIDFMERFDLLWGIALSENNDEDVEWLEMLYNFIKQKETKKDTFPKCIGRVTSSTYFTANGFETKKTFRILKRKSQLEVRDFIDDLEYGLPINFNEVDDGIYELICTNYSKDWETGIIDDWDVKLVPYKEY